MIAALGLRPGNVAAEAGAGPGYFSLRLARAVGPEGHVFAADVEPKMLEVLCERLVASRTGNVTPVLSLPGDPLLPPSTCDLALIVNSFHHSHPALCAFTHVTTAPITPGRAPDARYLPSGTNALKRSRSGTFSIHGKPESNGYPKERLKQNRL